MTLTADSVGDALSILGRYGITTSETANPDKVLIDIDLAALPGLEVDGSNLLKAKVDGTTVQVNGSGQLVAVAGDVYLDDLTDVTAPAPATNDMVAWVNASADWEDLAASITGTTAAGTSSQSAVYSLSTSTSQAATSSHTHTGSTSKVADDTHTHSTSYGNTGGPDDTTSVITAIGSPDSTITAVTNVSTSSVSNVTPNTHTHGAGTLGVSFA